jgi:hypothetical protein
MTQILHLQNFTLRDDKNCTLKSLDE